MSTDCRPADSAAKSDPHLNAHFRARWNEPTITGPDIPADPAHGTAWRAGEAGDPNTTGRHRSRAWMAAERAFAGDRGTVYRRGGA